MKVQLYVNSDDSFTLEVETSLGVDPTAAEANFVSQMIEAALPEVRPEDKRDKKDPNPGQDTWPIKLGMAEDALGDGNSELGVRLWAESVVDVVESAGVRRGEVMRALAEELNRRGVEPGVDEEVRIHGGPWKSDKDGEIQRHKMVISPGQFVDFKIAGNEYAMDDGDAVYLVQADDGVTICWEFEKSELPAPTPAVRTVPTPKDLLG